MKLWKLWKNNCAPCAMLDKMLEQIAIPEEIEFIKLNVEEDADGKWLMEKYKFAGVPVLLFENGKYIMGTTSLLRLKQFIANQE